VLGVTVLPVPIVLFVFLSFSVAWSQSEDSDCTEPRLVPIGVECVCASVTVNVYTAPSRSKKTDDIFYDNPDDYTAHRRDLFTWQPSSSHPTSPSKNGGLVSRKTRLASMFTHDPSSHARFPGSQLFYSPLLSQSSPLYPDTASAYLHPLPLAIPFYIIPYS